ncbi:hypothetical protein ElyMa_001830000 [Elysia marginata]|uniref:Uncharacterized protein n=1 Tax=Elysia marginata TaxID=1093978 RepID=A0AAV4EIE0_9GAST|nr:hypothetical protein ElyMa_001830000 [Elysia marginata]
MNFKINKLHFPCLPPDNQRTATVSPVEFVTSDVSSDFPVKSPFLELISAVHSHIPSDPNHLSKSTSFERESSTASELLASSSIFPKTHASSHGTDVVSSKVHEISSDFEGESNTKLDKTSSLTDTAVDMNSRQRQETLISGDVSNINGMSQTSSSHTQTLSVNKDFLTKSLSVFESTVSLVSLSPENNLVFTYDSPTPELFTPRPDGSQKVQADSSQSDEDLNTVTMHGELTTDNAKSAHSGISTAALSNFKLLSTFAEAQLSLTENSFNSVNINTDISSGENPQTDFSFMQATFQSKASVFSSQHSTITQGSSKMADVSSENSKKADIASMSETASVSPLPQTLQFSAVEVGQGVRDLASTDVLSDKMLSQTDGSKFALGTLSFAGVTSEPEPQSRHRRSAPAIDSNLSEDQSTESQVYVTSGLFVGGSFNTRPTATLFVEPTPASYFQISATASPQLTTISTQIELSSFSPNSFSSPQSGILSLSPSPTRRDEQPESSESKNLLETQSSAKVGFGTSTEFVSHLASQKDSLLNSSRGLNTHSVEGFVSLTPSLLLDVSLQPEDKNSLTISSELLQTTRDEVLFPHSLSLNLNDHDSSTSWLPGLSRFSHTFDLHETHFLTQSITDNTKPTFSFSETVAISTTFETFESSVMLSESEDSLGSSKPQDLALPLDSRGSLSLDRTPLFTGSHILPSLSLEKLLASSLPIDVSAEAKVTLLKSQGLSASTSLELVEETSALTFEIFPGFSVSSLTLQNPQVLETLSVRSIASDELGLRPNYSELMSSLEFNTSHSFEDLTQTSRDAKLETVGSIWKEATFSGIDASSTTVESDHVASSNAAVLNPASNMISNISDISLLVETVSVTTLATDFQSLVPSFTSLPHYNFASEPSVSLQTEISAKTPSDVFFTSELITLPGQVLPNASLVSIDYVDAGSVTSLPETSTAIATLGLDESQAIISSQPLLKFNQSLTPTTMTDSLTIAPSFFVEPDQITPTSLFPVDTDSSNYSLFPGIDSMALAASSFADTDFMTQTPSSYIDIDFETFALSSFADIDSMTLPLSLFTDIDSTTLAPSPIADIDSMTLKPSLFADIDSMTLKPSLFADIDSMAPALSLFSGKDSLILETSSLADIGFLTLTPSSLADIDSTTQKPSTFADIDSITQNPSLFAETDLVSLVPSSFADTNNVTPTPSSFDAGLFSPQSLAEGQAIESFNSVSIQSNFLFHSVTENMTEMLQSITNSTTPENAISLSSFESISPSYVQIDFTSYDFNRSSAVTVASSSEDFIDLNSITMSELNSLEEIGIITPTLMGTENATDFPMMLPTSSINEQNASALESISFNFTTIEFIETETVFKSYSNYGELSSAVHTSILPTATAMFSNSKPTFSKFQNVTLLPSEPTDNETGILTSPPSSFKETTSYYTIPSQSPALSSTFKSQDFSEIASYISEGSNISVVLNSPSLSDIFDASNGSQMESTQLHTMGNSIEFTAPPTAFFNTDVFSLTDNINESLNELTDSALMSTAVFLRPSLQNTTNIMSTIPYTAAPTLTGFSTVSGNYTFSDFMDLSSSAKGLFANTSSASSSPTASVLSTTSSSLFNENSTEQLHHSKLLFPSSPTESFDASKLNLSSLLYTSLMYEALSTDLFTTTNLVDRMSRSPTDLFPSSSTATLNFSVMIESISGEATPVPSDLVSGSFLLFSSQVRLNKTYLCCLCRRTPLITDDVVKYNSMFDNKLTSSFLLV